MISTTDFLVLIPDEYGQLSDIAMNAQIDIIDPADRAAIARVRRFNDSGGDY